MLYEFRSDNYDSLLDAKAYFERVLADFRAEGLEIEAELLGERPCGKKDNADPRQAALLALCAGSIQKRAGFAPEFHPGSTDCNIPLSLGIPSICVGCYNGSGSHTREEYVEISSLRPGLAFALDLILQHF